MSGPREPSFRGMEADLATGRKTLAPVQCRPLSPKFEQRLRWMETESRFAYSCPDLDQEFDYEDQAQGQRERQRLVMFPIVHSLVGWFLVFATIVGAAVAIKIVIEWSHHG